MTSKQGTGEEIGRIEVNNELEIILEDDGDDDAYTFVSFDWDSGIKSTNVYIQYRNEVGDEKLAEDLENVEGDNYSSLL